jgi:RNA polymerase sigma-70 factor (ECF subfamily)
MVEENHHPNFEHLILLHLDVAHNLARWLICNPAVAEDVVKEAFLRALRFFDGFRGGDSCAWLLKIVRKTCHSWIRKNRPTERFDEFDETVHSRDALGEVAEAKLVSRSVSERLTKAIETLPTAFREILVLREFEGHSYNEISDVTGIQMGTVMSSLSRARQRLREELRPPPEREPSRGSHLRLTFLAQGAASD